MVARGRPARLPARGAGDRRGAVDPGPARAARPSSRRRPTSSTPGSRTRRSDFLTWLNLWRYVRDPAAGAVAPARSAGCAGRSTSTTCGSASGRTLEAPAARRSPSSSGSTRRPEPARRAGRATASTRRCWPGCSRTSGCATPRSATTSAPATRGSRSSRAPGCSGSSRSCVMAAELVETSRLWAPGQRRDRAGVGRGARRAPGQAHLLRAALVEEAGRGDGLRAGHAVRRAAGRRPAGVLRPGRPGAVAASCSSGTRWSRASGRPSTGSSRDNRELLDEVEELEHRARRRDILVDERDAVRLLRRAGRRRGGVRRALRHLVEDRPAATTPTC